MLRWTLAGRGGGWWRGVAWVVLSTVAFAPGIWAQDEGTIRIWGHGHRGQDYILTLLRAWQEGFRAGHPGVKFVDELDGDASAVGGLFTGAAELAVMDREASFIEVDAFQQGAGYDPFRVPVARGSVATVHHAPALRMYVNRANPLSRLSVEQLDGIFDADHRLAGKSYKTWGDLGLTGEWAARPIQMDTYGIQSAEMQFFERAAMKGSQKFSCCMTMFTAKPGMTAESQIAAAVAKDPYGLALTTLAAPGLKAVLLSRTEGEAPMQGNAATIMDGSYPLARTVYVYANRKPKGRLRADVAEFLEYITGPQGQAIVARVGGYLPLSPELAAQATEALR